MPDCFRIGALRFGGRATATDGAAGGGAAGLFSLTAILFGAIAFAFLGATAFAAFLAVADFFGAAVAAAFGADFLRALALRSRAFAPAALDRLFLLAARTSFFFLPAPCFDAFTGFLRFAACLRLVAMGAVTQSAAILKTLKAGT